MKFFTKKDDACICRNLKCTLSFPDVSTAGVKQMTVISRIS